MESHGCNCITPTSASWVSAFSSSVYLISFYIHLKSWLKIQHSKTKITASSSIISRQMVGETMETVRNFIFLGSKITANGDCSHDQPRQSIKKQRHYFADKGPCSQNYVFSSSHVWMCELDVKESWRLKNWCFWTVVLEKTLESALDCKEIQPVHPKGDQSWIFIGRADVEAETLILWPPNEKNWLIEKTLMLGKTKAGGEGDDRGRDGWMVSPTQWTWVWVSSWN